MDKNAFLQKLKKQKAKAKKNIEFVPIKKLTSKEKKAAFVPTLNTLEKQNVVEQDMRNFLSSIVNFQNDDFNELTNPLILRAFLSYKLSQSNSDEKEVIQKWNSLSLYDKKIMVIERYIYSLKTSKFQTKNFLNKININLRTNEQLDNFIHKYLNSHKKFSSRDLWNRVSSPPSQKVQKQEEKEDKKEMSKSKENKIAFQKNKYGKLLQEQKNLQKKYNFRRRKLESLNEEKLKSIMLTDKHSKLYNETKESLIITLITLKYSSERKKEFRSIYGEGEDSILTGKKQFDLDPQKTLKFQKYLKILDEKISRDKKELADIPRDKIIQDIQKRREELWRNSSQDKKDLIILILNSEFRNKKSQLNKKFFQLEEKQIPFKKVQSQLEPLTGKEKDFKINVLVALRKAEISVWSEERLMLLASQKGIKIQNLPREKQLTKILLAEYPEYQIKHHKLSQNEMYRVLETLDNEHIIMMATMSGSTNAETNGKQKNIKIILRKEYGKSKSPIKAQFLKGDLTTRIEGKQTLFKIQPKDDVRFEELKNYTRKALEILAYESGVDLPFSSVSDKDFEKERDKICRDIIIKENTQDRILSRDEKEKRHLSLRLSKLIGGTKQRYNSWTLEELQNRLNIYLDYEENSDEEIRQYILSELDNLIDMKDEKYFGISGWNLKKLKNTINGLNPNWQSNMTLSIKEKYIKCIKERRYYKWLKGNVSAVWLRSSRENKKPPSKYILKNIWLKIDNKKWYQASREFFSLQCNPKRYRRTQSGEILTCITTNTKKISFRVGFTIKGYQGGKYKPYLGEICDVKNCREKKKIGCCTKKVPVIFVIQDEDIFLSEQKYLNMKERNFQDDIKDILDEYVNEKSVNFVSQMLSDKLHNLAPSKPDYGIVKYSIKPDNKYPDAKNWELKKIDSNTPYMNILMDTLRKGPSEINLTLFRNTANLLIFLSIPEARSFRNNIKKEYYLPDILAKLSFQEKFPEVFEDPNIDNSFKENLTLQINRGVNKLVDDMAENLYYSQNPSQRILTRINPAVLEFPVKTKDRLSNCVNKSKMENILSRRIKSARKEGKSKEFISQIKNQLSSEIIYYKDEDKIYCFTFSQLYKQFASNDSKNPDSGKDFRAEFIQKFDRLYNNILSKEGFLSKHFTQKYGTDVKEVISTQTNKKTTELELPNLWSIIGGDIKELENELPQKFLAEGDSVNVRNEKEGGTTDWKDIQIPPLNKGGNPMTWGEEMDQESKVDGDEGTTKEDEGTKKITQDLACEYCKKHIADGTIKSIIRHENKSKIIHFCSFKCFENKNDWNKFVKDKKKKRKKQKKKDGIIPLLDLIPSKESTKDPLEMSLQEIKEMKDKMRLKIKEGVVEYDRTALPLFTKNELKELAKEKGFKIPGGLSKMGVAKFIFESLHPKATKSVYKEKIARRKMKKKKFKKKK